MTPRNTTPTHAGQRLREARLAAGLSQEELGVAAQLQQTHISRLEGRASFADTTGGTLDALATALGTTTDYLLGRTKTP